MGIYRPSEPFSTPMYLLIPIYTTVKGSSKKSYPPAGKGELFFGAFKSYGGTETESNGTLVVEDTVNVETWYRPDIKSDCRVVLGNDTASVYEIIGEPENISMRNQFLKFKVRRVKGGV